MRLTLPQLERAIQQAWASSLGETIPTAYPGVEFRSAGQTQWVELWVTPWTGRVARETGLQGWELVITLHVSIRPEVGPAAAQELVSRLVTWWSGRVIPVTQELDAQAEREGLLQCREPVVRDGSRDQQPVSQTGLRQFVITIPAIATPY